MAPVTLAERDAPKSLAQKLSTPTSSERIRSPAQPALSQFMGVARDGPPAAASYIFPAVDCGLPTPLREIERQSIMFTKDTLPPSFLVKSKLRAKSGHRPPPPPQSMAIPEAVAYSSFQSEIKDTTKLPPTPGGVLPPPSPPPPKQRVMQQSTRSLGAAQYEAQGEKSHYK